MSEKRFQFSLGTAFLGMLAMAGMVALHLYSFRHSPVIWFLVNLCDYFAVAALLLIPARRLAQSPSPLHRLMAIALATPVVLLAAIVAAWIFSKLAG